MRKLRKKQPYRQHGKLFCEGYGVCDSSPAYREVLLDEVLQKN